jgi:hypothetical protein
MRKAFGQGNHGQTEATIRALPHFILPPSPFVPSLAPSRLSGCISFPDLRSPASYLPSQTFSKIPLTCIVLIR